MTNDTLPTYEQLTNLHPLAEAVINQMGFNDGDDLEYLISSLEDAANLGASGGFSGFIYYNETVKFAEDNRKDITSMLTQDAEIFCHGVIEMVTEHTRSRAPRYRWAWGKPSSRKLAPRAGASARGRQARTTQSRHERVGLADQHVLRFLIEQAGRDCPGFRDWPEREQDKYLRRTIREKSPRAGRGNGHN